MYICHCFLYDKIVCISYKITNANITINKIENKRQRLFLMVLAVICAPCVTVALVARRFILPVAAVGNCVSSDKLRFIVAMRIYI
ncbi:MAG: hypothetical protein ACI8VI_001988 [Granulosicoccus sp.]|jgi:hypothetical protein